MVTRRKMLLGAGGAGLVLIGAGTSWRVMREPTSAVAPWSLDPAPVADVRLDAFRHAILAPNPHNRQPWQIELVGRDQAVITCDLDRRLPETDPFDRQITIGFGAFVELARIAATQRGIRVDITPFPEGEPLPRLDRRPIARLTFVADPTVQRSPLVDAILTRRSVKQPFDESRPLPDADAATLIGHAGAGARWQTTRNAGKVAELKAITWDAWQIEANTPRAHKESVDLMRIGATEVSVNPDGVSLRGPLIEGLLLTGQISRAQMLDPTSSVTKIGQDRYRTMLAASPSYAWLTTETGSRAAQFEAGRSTMRFTLEASRRGLSVHPVSQALQEFTEMVKPFAAVRSALGVPREHQLQMLLRIGYGPGVAPAPRWPLAAKLKVT